MILLTRHVSELRGVGMVGFCEKYLVFSFMIGPEGLTSWHRDQATNFHPGLGFNRSKVTFGQRKKNNEPNNHFLGKISNLISDGWVQPPTSN